MSDRRRAPRVEPRAPMRAKVKASVPARIVDISTSGAQLEVLTSLRPNVGCELRLELEGAEITIASTVRRCRAWGFGFDDADRRVLLYRAGLEFDQVPARLVDRLREELAHGGPSVAALFAPEAQSSPGPAASPADGEEAPPRRAPRPDGPVKIRIGADHIRAILEREKK